MDNAVETMWFFDKDYLVRKHGCYCGVAIGEGHVHMKNEAGSRKVHGLR